ncbi:MAG TPA: outer membrane beta-barrel protein, partial [Ignavibacteriaceae bacterium]|nr:outer membrane beta-barrel protein [Ignavibacteriaceae bacterium]
QRRNYSAESTAFQYLFEARVGYMAANNLWIDAGIFPSHIGLESTLNYENWNLSHSIIAHNSPFYEAGAKITYTNDQWLFSFLLLNGWQIIRDNNSNKGLGTQIQFKPVSNILLNSSTYLGEGYNLPDSLVTDRIFHNFYCIVDWNSNVSSAISFDYGWQKFMSDDEFHNWWGAAFVTKYNVTPYVSIAGRVEYYNDEENIIIAAPDEFKTSGYSMNLDYKPVNSFIFRVEGKMFNASKDIFIKDNELQNSDAMIIFSGIFRI